MVEKAKYKFEKFGSLIQATAIDPKPLEDEEISEEDKLEEEASNKIYIDPAHIIRLDYISQEAVISMTNGSPSTIPTSPKDYFQLVTLWNEMKGVSLSTSAPLASSAVPQAPLQSQERPAGVPPGR